MSKAAYVCGLRHSASQRSKQWGLLPCEPFTFTLLTFTDYWYCPSLRTQRMIERWQKRRKGKWKLLQGALVMMGEQPHFHTWGTVHASQSQREKREMQTIRNCEPHPAEQTSIEEASLPCLGKKFLLSGEMACID